MDMKRHDFESSIKCSDSYAKLIYMHGEKLFIFDDGKYKIAAMQLAWEIYCDRCEEIKLLKAQQAKVEELQKRVDSLTQTMGELLEEMKYPTATFEEVIVCGVKELEQALKGEG